MERKIAAAFFILFAVHLVFAGEIKAWQAEAEIDIKGFTRLDLLFIADSSDGKIVVPDFDCIEISVYDEKGNLAYEAANESITAVPRTLSQNYSFSMHCIAPALARKERNWVFSIGFPFDGSGSIKVILPDGALLTKSRPEGKVYIEGSRLTVSLEGSKEVLMEYSFLHEGKNSGADYFLYLVAAIVVLTGALLFFMSKNKRTEEKTVSEIPLAGKKDDAKENDFMKYLNANEKKIMDLIVAEKRITQRKIQTESGLPKSTLSRTLKRLEAKGIIKTVSAGNTKFVELLCK